MSKPDYLKILKVIADCDDREKLARITRNASRQGAEDVEHAARRKLISLVPGKEPGTLEHDFWQMVNAFELARSEENGKTTRLSRTRLKVARVGEVRTLKDWALGKRETEGYAMLIDYGMPELTGEAIVVRHKNRFDPEVVDAARRRLAESGLDAGSFEA